MKRPAATTSPAALPAASPPQANPFCTRCVRPGALPFLFPPGENVESLLHRLQANGWWGEIIGEHGTGKSTLLATLLPAVRETGRRTLEFSLHDGQRRLPAARLREAAAMAGGLIAVDGYEQLGSWSRFRLRRFCRRRAVGLLVTAHASVGFPLLFQTAGTFEIAQRVVHELLSREMTPSEVQRMAVALARHAGNIREVLFTLYDDYESSRREHQARV